MRAVWIIVAAAGVVAGTWLASIGATAVVFGVGDRDARALLALLPLVVGGLVLIGAVRMGRLHVGDGRGWSELPRPVVAMVQVLLGVVLTLQVLFLAGIVRYSGGWDPSSPASGDGGQRLAWDMLLYSWLVAGTYLAAMVLPAVGLGKMASLPVVGVVMGVLLTIVGLLGRPTRYELFVPLVGAAIAVASALVVWRRSAFDPVSRGEPPD